MGELSRGVRGVVFVFDLLMNFKFAFSHLNTFGHHPLGQCPSLRLRLGPLRGRLPVSLSRPPLGPPPGPPLKSDPFCVDGLTQDGNFWSRSSPALFWPRPDPSWYWSGMCPLGTETLENSMDLNCFVVLLTKPMLLLENGAHLQPSSSWVFPFWCLSQKTHES